MHLHSLTESSHWLCRQSVVLRCKCGIACTAQHSRNVSRTSSIAWKSSLSSRCGKDTESPLTERARGSSCSAAPARRVALRPSASLSQMKTCCDISCSCACSAHSSCGAQLYKLPQRLHSVPGHAQMLPQAATTASLKENTVKFIISCTEHAQVLHGLHGVLHRGPDPGTRRCLHRLQPPRL